MASCWNASLEANQERERARELLLQRLVYCTQDPQQDPYITFRFKNIWKFSMQTEQRPHRHFQVGQKKAIAGSIPPSSLLAASILCMLTAAALLWAYLLSK